MLSFLKNHRNLRIGKGKFQEGKFRKGKGIRFGGSSSILQILNSSNIIYQILRGISAEGGDTLHKDAQGQRKRQQTSCLWKFCLYIKENYLTVGRVIIEIVRSRGGDSRDVCRAILSGRAGDCGGVSRPACVSRESQEVARLNSSKACRALGAASYGSKCWKTVLIKTKRAQ